MTSWLIPANTKFYDVFAALALTETYWPMNAKVSDRDRIYLYLAAPHKQIGFVCEVLETGVEFAGIAKQVMPFVKGETKDGPPAKAFMKIKPLKVIPIEKDSLLGLSHLKVNGLNGMLMGARKLENNPSLQSYIEGVLK